MSDIRVMMFDRRSGLHTGGEELLASAADVEDSWVWVDLDGVDKDQERELLMQKLGISLLAIQDAQRDRHPPKQELFDNYLFLLIRELDAGTAPGDDRGFNHIAMFAGEKFLVTRRSIPSASVDEVWKTTTIAQLEKGPAHIVYRILRHVVDRFTPFVVSMEEQLADIEDKMFEHPSDDLLEDLAVYNRILKRLRRTLAYQHIVMKQVAQSNEGVMRLFDNHEFNDIYENMERLASLCQLNQELAVDLLNTYLSVASHRLNQIMRMLTIVAVIFLPLTLLAGVYGMNFDYIPELHWRYGYFTVIGIMLVLAVGVIFLLKRKKWL